jgi:hypothetical protein
MGRKKLLDISGDRFRVYFRLKKSEAALFRAFCRSETLKEVCPRPGSGDAVAALIRIAFRCFQDHTERYQDPTPLEYSQALEQGLITHRRPGLRLARSDKRPSRPRKST